LAKAAENAHPETSLEICGAKAESLIAERDRHNLQAACEYLKRIKRLHSKLDQHDYWEEYIANLCNEDRSLRAFQDEIRRARQ